MLDAWKRCLLLFYGGGIAGRREGGEGALVKPICTSDALSIPRTADNFTGLYLRCSRCLEPKGGRALPTPTRLRIFLFPVNTFAFYLLSPSFPPFPGFSIFSLFLFSFGSSSVVRDFFRIAILFRSSSIPSFRFLNRRADRCTLSFGEFFFLYFRDAVFLIVCISKFISKRAEQFLIVW